MIEICKSGWKEYETRISEKRVRARNLRERGRWTEVLVRSASKDATLLGMRLKRR